MLLWGFGWFPGEMMHIYAGHKRNGCITVVQGLGSMIGIQLTVHHWSICQSDRSTDYVTIYGLHVVWKIASSLVAIFRRYFTSILHCNTNFCIQWIVCTFTVLCFDFVGMTSFFLGCLHVWKLLLHQEQCLGGILLPFCIVTPIFVFNGLCAHSQYFVLIF